MCNNIMNWDLKISFKRIYMISHTQDVTISSLNGREHLYFNEKYGAFLRFSSILILKLLIARTLLTKKRIIKIFVWLLKAMFEMKCAF